MVEDGANDCYNCSKSGHYARDCRLLKRVEENTKLVIEEEKVNGIVMMAYEEVVEEEVLIAYEDDTGIDTQWYLDTAARNYMCSDKGLFLEMKEVVDGSVPFSDEAKVQVKEARTLCFSHTGKQIPTKDEYHVSILNTKLEWCSQNNQNVMVNRGVKVKEEGGDVKVHEESAWEHKNQNVVDGQQKPIREQQTLMYFQQTSYKRGEGSNSRLNQIRVDIDVDENIMENKEHRDDEDLLEAGKMNKDVKEAMAQEFVMGDLGLNHVASRDQATNTLTKNSEQKIVEHAQDETQN
ncbi:retrovirus-related pol polyprotein from transposon TNT 1-94 [Tanacetum coccineum]